MGALWRLLTLPLRAPLPPAPAHRSAGSVGAHGDGRVDQRGARRGDEARDQAHERQDGRHAWASTSKSRWAITPETTNANASPALKPAASYTRASRSRPPDLHGPDVALAIVAGEIEASVPDREIDPIGRMEHRVEPDQQPRRPAGGRLRPDRRIPPGIVRLEVDHSADPRHLLDGGRPRHRRVDQGTLGAR